MATRTNNAQTKKPLPDRWDQQCVDVITKCANAPTLVTYIEAAKEITCAWEDFLQEYASCLKGSSGHRCCWAYWTTIRGMLRRTRGLATANFGVESETKPENVDDEVLRFVARSTISRGLRYYFTHEIITIMAYYGLCRAVCSIDSHETRLQVPQIISTDRPECLRMLMEWPTLLENFSGEAERQRLAHVQGFADNPQFTIVPVGTLYALALSRSLMTLKMNSDGGRPVKDDTFLAPFETFMQFVSEDTGQWLQSALDLDTEVRLKPVIHQMSKAGPCRYLGSSEKYIAFCPPVWINLGLPTPATLYSDGDEWNDKNLEYDRFSLCRSNIRKSGNPLDMRRFEAVKNNLLRCRDLLLQKRSMNYYICSKLFQTISSESGQRLSSVLIGFSLATLVLISWPSGAPKEAKELVALLSGFCTEELVRKIIPALKR